MKKLNRIARPCGIAGGVWAVLLAVLLSLFIPTRFITTTIGGRSWGFQTSVAESWAWGVLTIIILMALMGLLGLLAVILAKRSHRLSRVFIWVSGILLASGSIFMDYPQMGFVFLVFTAMGMIGTVLAIYFNKKFWW